VARLLVVWTQPMHLSREEADRWVLAETGRLLELPVVARLELTRMARASEKHSKPWDWLLEVHLSEGADTAAWAEDPLVTDWLSDLRLLGMRPAVVRANCTRVLRRGEG
jgi:hypothetical protein